VGPAEGRMPARSGMAVGEAGGFNAVQKVFTGAGSSAQDPRQRQTSSRQALLGAAALDAF